MTVAILCSGQGGQHRGMFRLTGNMPAAAPMFAAATALMDGVDPRQFVLEAQEDALFENRTGQILCCTQALAAWSMFGDARPSTVVLAGYSVGELAAWGCAGFFDASQTLRLAAERATLMDRVSPDGSGLAAFVGLRRQALDTLLGGRATVAIVNGAESFVVGGADEALDACLADAKRSAIRAVRLRVGVASHTTMMEAAARAFGAMLRDETLHPPTAGIRLLQGIDAETVRDASAGLRALASQVGQAIDWAACLQACREAGATSFLELGPGGALARMAGDARARSLEDFMTEQGVRDWLAQAD